MKSVVRMLLIKVDSKKLEYGMSSDLTVSLLYSLRLAMNFTYAMCEWKSYGMFSILQ